MGRNEKGISKSNLLRNIILGFTFAIIISTLSINYYILCERPQFIFSTLSINYYILCERPQFIFSTLSINYYILCVRPQFI